MVSKFDFNCKTSAGQDLCFNGGVCRELNASQIEPDVCICPEGFGPDFTLFHSPNCALPNSTLEIFAGTFSAVWLIVFIWYVNRIRYLPMKSRVRQLAAVGLVNSLSLEASVILLAAQNGFFEGSLISFAINLLSIMVFVTMITLQMFEFAHGMYANRVRMMRSALNYILVGYTVGILTTASACIALSHTNELWKFDVALCVFLGTTYFTITFLCLIALKYINEFIGLLGAPGNEREQVEFSKMGARLKSMKKLSAAIIMNQISNAILLVLVRSLLGSFPYAWTIMIFAYLILLAFPLGIARLFPEFQKSSIDEKKSSKWAVVGGVHDVEARGSKDSSKTCSI
jgi:hypothetical protein